MSTQEHAGGSGGWHIAQANWARALHELDDPRMKPFVDRLDRFNALAEASPGFVWRLQTEEGNATEIQVFGDDRIIFNLTVWESIETLEEYVYRTDHIEAIQRRREWFEHSDKAAYTMWWIPAGRVPTVEEAEAKLRHIWEHGPTPEAFDFKHRFPVPRGSAAV